MSKKVYRTSQGKTIDLGALQLQNETTRAVGNMGVNARGDKVSPQNKVTESRNSSVNRTYKKQTKTNVIDDVVVESKRSGKKQKSKPEPVVEQEVLQEEEVLHEETEELVVEEKAKITEPKSIGGLAGAIAKAKQVKQEPMKTPRQLAQSQPGVKKI